MEYPPGVTNKDIDDLYADNGKECDDEWIEDLRTWPIERREEWEERAAIRQFEGGMTALEAEKAAYFDMKKEGAK